LARRRNDGFHIEWHGLHELEQLFDDIDENAIDIVKEEYSKYGMLVEEGTKALAPHDEGDLEDSISFDRAQQHGDSIVVEGGASAKHAVIRHEMPYRKGVHPKYDNGAKFPDYYQEGRGEGTRMKPAWRGLAPGRKFMQNAINATLEDYNKMNERILERTLRGDHRR
jgi:hypothetical protein